MFFSKGGTQTVIGSATSVAFSSGSFHYVEVEVVISTTVGVLQLKWDQTSMLNLTSVNNQASANASFNQVHLGGMLGGALSVSSGLFPALLIDDVYFDTGGFNGDVRINGQLPSGNGSTQNFTAVAATWPTSTAVTVGKTIVDSNGNLQRVISISGTGTTAGTHPTWATSVGVNTTDNSGANQVTWVCLGAPSQYNYVNEPNPDGDSSYIKSSNVSDVSRFIFPAIVGPSIKTVMVWANARKDDGGLRTIQASVKSGATVATSGTDVPLGGNYQYLLMQLPTDPNTGVAWTASGVNSAEIGVKLTN
jgi:hypothetical protein